MNCKELKAALNLAKSQFESNRKNPSLPSFFAALHFVDELDRLWQKFMRLPVPKARASKADLTARRAAFADIMGMLRLFLECLNSVSPEGVEETYIIQTGALVILADLYRNFRQKMLPFLGDPPVGVITVLVPVDGGTQTRDLLLMITAAFARMLRKSKEACQLQQPEPSDPNEARLRELNDNVHALAAVLIAVFIDIAAASSGQFISERDRATQFMTHILSLSFEQYSLLIKLGSELDPFHSFLRRSVAVLYLKSQQASASEDAEKSVEVMPSAEQQNEALKFLDRLALCETANDLQQLKIAVFFNEWAEALIGCVDNSCDPVSFSSALLTCQFLVRVFALGEKTSVISASYRGELKKSAERLTEYVQHQQANFLQREAAEAARQQKAADEAILASWALDTCVKGKKKQAKPDKPQAPSKPAHQSTPVSQRSSVPLSPEERFLQKLAQARDPLTSKLAQLDEYLAKNKISSKAPNFLKFQLQRAEWLLQAEAKIKNYKAQLNVLNSVPGAQDKLEVKTLCEKLSAKIAELIKIELDAKLAPIYALLVEPSAENLKLRLEEKRDSLAELAKNPDYTADIKQCIEAIEQRIKALFKAEIAADLLNAEQLLARAAADVKEHEYLSQWHRLKQLAEKPEYREFISSLLEEIEAKINWSSCANLGLSSEAKAILTSLNQHWASYAVGGVVRDQILGRKVKDEDFVCLGDQFSVFELKETWDELQKALIEILKRQDVSVSLSPNCESLLVVKLGFYPDQQRFEVFFSKAKTCEEDALTRDFSLNAMYLNAQAGLAYAQPGAIEACKKRELVFVNRQTFYEDPVRLLRAWVLRLDDFHFVENAEEELFKQYMSDLKSKNTKELRAFLGENLGRFMAKWVEVLDKAARLGKVSEVLVSFNCSALFGLLDVNGKGLLNQHAEYRAFLTPWSLDLAESTDSASPRSPRSSGSEQAEAPLAAQQRLFAPPNGVGVSPAARQMREVFSQRFGPNG